MNLLFRAIIPIVAYMVGRATAKRSAGQAALPPAPTIEVGPQCSTWAVVDQDRLELTFRFIYARERLRGVTDPLLIANAVVKQVAPRCRGYGEAPPRNQGEYDLYVSLAEEVVEEMYGDQTLSPAAAEAAKEQIAAWQTLIVTDGGS